MTDKLMENLVEIYRVIKQARDEKRLTDQEFILIKEYGNKIEKLFHEMPFEHRIIGATQEKIYYTEGYKYQIRYNYLANIGLHPPADIITKWIHLYKEGLLGIVHGFASDGPSGPTIDTKDFMRGAFEHDGLYWLLRHGFLDNMPREDIAKDILAIDAEAEEDIQDILDSGEPDISHRLVRLFADIRLIQVCDKDGMESERQWWVYHALRWAGRSASLEENKKKILCAP